MNGIRIAGKVSDVEFSHTVGETDYFKGFISAKRNSGYVDKIPFVSRKELNGKVAIVGEVRTRNNEGHLEIYVYVLDVEEYERDENVVIGDGFVCKEPRYRVTPLLRTICDVIIACNRRNGKADYLPSIAWKENATFVSQLNVGTHISYEGRLQSRIYHKEDEQKVAYELSISEVKEIEDE